MQTNLSILVLEDLDDDAILLRRALHKAGHTSHVYVCSQPAQAIEYVNGEGDYSDRQQFPFPTLIFVDLHLQMPKDDGFSFLQWLNHHPQYSVIPKIVMTASSRPVDIQKAYRLGANSYMVKPPAFLELVEKMRSVCEFWKYCAMPPDLTPESAI